MTVWTVPGLLCRVVDADTVHANLDLGWGVWRQNAPIRLSGIDAPELSTPVGRAARTWLMDWLGNLPVPCTVVSHSIDKYGRVLANVQVGAWDLCAALVQAGQAKPWSGTGPRP
jgi:endonuclease YncB( thermonuclease family)